MAITLDGTNGITSSGVITGPDGSASAPAITNDGDTNTGIFFPAADTIAFAEGGAEVARFDSSGNLIVGATTSDQSAKFVVYNGSNNHRVAAITRPSTTTAALFLGTNGNTNDAMVSANNSNLCFGKDVSGTVTEYARIDSDGKFLVGTTNTSPTTNNVNGFALLDAGQNIRMTATSSNCLDINRKTDDGNLVLFRQDGTTEGTISVSGSTVSYNGGHLSRWAQMPGTKDDTLVKGTVMSNLDEMNVYTDAEGNPVDNEQLNKVKVSDVEGDVNVAGVFVNWTYDDAHQVDEINMAMTGDMIIRIAQGVVVQKGDLLMSAGDGTAKPQDDDIVRSKTVAKVTSNHVTCTYADGSYCVPCVLMAC
jgi:hypothetical protein